MGLKMTVTSLFSLCSFVFASILTEDGWRAWLGRQYVCREIRGPMQSRHWKMTSWTPMIYIAKMTILALGR